nr:frigida-like protein 5 [Quercus suber]
MGIYSACSPPLSVFFAVGVAGFGSGEIGAWVRRRLGRGLVNRRLGSSVGSSVANRLGSSVGFLTPALIVGDDWYNFYVAMEKVDSDLKLLDLKQRGLRKAFEALKTQASSILLLTLQWEDLEEHLDSTRKSIETQFKELEECEKEMGLKVEGETIGFSAE